MSPACAAVPGLETLFLAHTWGQNDPVCSALSCAQPQRRRGWGSSNTCSQCVLGWRLPMDAGGSRGGTTASSLSSHSHLPLLTQAVPPDAVLSVKRRLATLSEAPFSFDTQGAHTPVRCVSSCVFCLNTIVPTPFHQR